MKLLRKPLLERVPLVGPASLTVREFRQAAFRYPWHEHPEVELTWILKGSGLRYVGDSVEPFRPGDFCLLGANLPHTWLSPEGWNAGVRSLVVQFDVEHWKTGLLTLPECSRIASLLARAQCGLCFDAALGSRLRRKFDTGASPLARLTALLEILDELAACADAKPLALSRRSNRVAGNADPRIRQVLAYLSESAGEGVSQAEAARRVRLSPAAFSRFFRRAMGKPFQTYVTDLRLGEVCRQLLESNRTISEIAFDAGFGNLSNFNRSFRIARGMTPSDFRRHATQAG